MKWDLGKIYAFKFFDDLVLVYPFYILLFVESGLSATEVSSLLIAWSVVTFVLEIPSGVLADRVPRKYVLIAGQLARALSFGIWIFWPTFTGFLIGVVLWGVKSACTSGTFQALVYDLLKSDNEEASYAKVIGRARTASYIGVLVAAGLASVAIAYGYTFVLVASAAAVALSALSIALVSAAPAFQSTHEKDYVSIATAGFCFLYTRQALLLLILFMALFHAQYLGIEEFFPILMTLDGATKSTIALMGIAFGVAQALASLLAHRFERFATFGIGLFMVLEGAFYVGAYYLAGIPSFAALVIASAMHTIFFTLYDARVQHTLDSGTRATVSSVQGLLTEGSAVLFYIVFGLGAGALGYSEAFFWFSLWVFGLGFLYLASQMFWRKEVSYTK
ncbi:MAG: MFS transporter [Patescibacteria group bacterium]